MLVTYPTDSCAMYCAFCLIKFAASKYMLVLTPNKGVYAITAAPPVEGCPIKLKSVK